MLDAHILRHGVSAPAAAAQGQGGGQPEVIQVADAALGGGGVDKDPAGLHSGGEGIQLVLGVHRVQIDRGGVAEAPVPDQPVGNVQRVGKVLCPVHGQHGRELLVGEGLAEVRRVHFTNEDLGALRHRHPRQGGDGVGGLAHDPGVQSAIHKNGAAKLLRLLLRQQMAAPGGELLPDGVIHVIQHHYALLGSADHTVVKGLGVDHGGHGQQNIGAVVNDGRGVAGAHAQGGLAGGVGGLYHAGAAGSQDQVRFPHDLIGQLQAGHIDPADDPLGSAGLYSRLQNHLGGGNGAGLCPGVGADDNGVPGLQADQGLEDGGGGGIGGGDHRGDDADGFRDPLDAVSFVGLQDAAGPGVLVGVVNVLGGVVILDHLVLHNAHARLGHGHLCQRNAHLVGRNGSRLENLVHLLLAVACEHLLRLTAALQSLRKLLSIRNDGIGLFHRASSFLELYQYFLTDNLLPI